MTVKPKDTASYRLTLCALPGWRNEPTQRLKAALKCLRRSFGLRCVSLAEVAANAESQLSMVDRKAEADASNGAKEPERRTLADGTQDQLA
jgi:hypothetical protein